MAMLRFGIKTYRDFSLHINAIILVYSLSVKFNGIIRIIREAASRRLCARAMAMFGRQILDKPVYLRKSSQLLRVGVG